MDIDEEAKKEESEEEEKEPIQEDQIIVEDVKDDRVSESEIVLDI